MGSCRSRWLALSFAAMVAGLLPLAWLPFAVRHENALVWGDPSTLSGFLSLLLRAEYGTFRLDAAGAGLKLDAGHLGLFARSLPAGFGLPMLGLTLAGIVPLTARLARTRSHRVVACAALLASCVV